ncbi:hypothetical protein KHQ88_01730 [Mycoplasmatota bacterium]|nr:hypothetical protein KHQ88_01730 [Mycoplasmatota bacterium]
MKKTEGVLLDHFNRYPKMQIEDFVKLIYQNSFGPKHMDSNPSLKTVEDYIHEELKSFTNYSGTHQVESIGNDYYRVSLSVIKSQLMTIQDLAKAFYQSMIESPIADDDSINTFTSQLKVLCDIISKDKIGFEKKNCEQWIEEYLDYGIRSIRHSEEYRENYFPHYRIVHKSVLKDYLDII